MRSSVGAGIVAGLIAGLVFGFMMQMMMAPTPDGGSVPMMGMVAQVVGSTSLLVGWLYHLFNSAVIGGIFGWLFAPKTQRYSEGLGKGAVYGFGWWILGGLVLMPVFLGMPAFSPLTNEDMRPVAWGSLMGHLVYGLILGGSYVGLRRKARPSEAAVAEKRAA